MAAVEKTVILCADDQEDRLDYDYYNSKVMKWVKYAHAHESLNWTVLATLLSSSTVGFVGKTSDKYVDDGIDFITNRNVRPFFFDEKGIQFVSEPFSQEIVHTKLVGNEVLICRSGAGVGACCVYPSERNEAVAGDILILRCGDELLPDYLMLYINSDIGSALLSRECSGSGVEHLNLTAIRNARIPKIEKEKQRNIVDRFWVIYSILVNLTSRVKSARKNEYKKIGTKIDLAFCSEIGNASFYRSRNAIFFLRDHALSERLDIPANHPDYTKLVAQIKASPNSGFLSDLVETPEDRFNPDEHIGQEIHYLAIGDIDGVSGNVIEPQKMLAEDLPSRARRLIHTGDILVGIAGASTGTENMVVFPVVSEQEGWVATTGFLVLRPRDGVDVHYVCSLLKAPFVLRQIRALLTSPAMPTISDTDFMQLAVPVTNSDARKTTLIEIDRVLNEERQLTIQLEQISEQIEQLLSEAKSNIFDLLDDDKFSDISARAMGIENAMAKIEEELQ